MNHCFREKVIDQMHYPTIKEGRQQGGKEGVGGNDDWTLTISFNRLSKNKWMAN